MPRLSKAATAAYGRSYYERNKDRHRLGAIATKLSGLYGLSLVRWLAMHQHQDSRCAVCRLPSTRAFLSVDHDHETGAVRGLLCVRCNAMAGRDSSQRAVLHKVDQYLRGQKPARLVYPWTSQTLMGNP